MINMNIQDIQLPQECIDWLQKIHDEISPEAAKELEIEAKSYMSIGFDYLGNVPDITPDDVPKKYHNGWVLSPNIFNIGQLVRRLMQKTTLADEGEIIDIKWNARMHCPVSLFSNKIEPSYKIKKSDGSIFWSQEKDLMLLSNAT